MGEINEALGRGKKFEVNGKEIEAFPAVFDDMEEAVEHFNKLAPNIVVNFMERRMKTPDGKTITISKETSIKNLMELLQMIFRDVPEETLRKLDRKQMEEAINFFLFE